MNDLLIVVSFIVLCLILAGVGAWAFQPKAKKAKPIVARPRYRNGRRVL